MFYDVADAKRIRLERRVTGRRNATLTNDRSFWRRRPGSLSSSSPTQSGTQIIMTNLKPENLSEMYSVRIPLTTNSAVE